MLCRFACAVFILGLGLGLAAGEELKGKIVKLDDKKLSFQTFSKETKKFDEAKDYEISKDVKVSKVEKKKTKLDVPEGLKAEAFTKIGSEGIQASIVVNDGKVSEIVLGGKKKKKNE
ncbi:MAG: hypothetical protein HY040_15005 [Planctomycetes bacterium]|nr:hypothetical protein [Planctomycetota bacterium]